jgi:hypothetical protein
MERNLNKVAGFFNTAPPWLFPPGLVLVLLMKKVMVIVHLL